MAFFPKRTLTVTTSSRLRNIFTGPRKISSSRLTVASPSKAFTTKSQDGTSISNNREKPRTFPTSGFKIIEADQQVEEEELPDYEADRFYPVRLGEVFHDRYQTIAKLGFGTSSTTWLARDLWYKCIMLLYFRRSAKSFSAHQYVALKVYVRSSLVHRELPSYHHISRLMAGSSHEGRSDIRRLLDSFKVTGPHGNHVVLVFEPAQMSLRDMKVVFRSDGFEVDFVKGAITELLKALDFLHTQEGIVHTGNFLYSSGHGLLGISSNRL